MYQSLRELKHHIPANKIELGLNKHIESFGGTCKKISLGPDWTHGTTYEILDKDGEFITSQLSQAWVWVCNQYAAKEATCKDNQ